MNCDFSSTESVADNLENIPEIEVAVFHEGVLLLFCVLLYLMILQFGVFCQVGIWLLVMSCQLSAISGQPSAEWQSAIRGQPSERIGIRRSVLPLAVSGDYFGGDGEGQGSLVGKSHSEQRGKESSVFQGTELDCNERGICPRIGCYLPCE